MTDWKIVRTSPTTIQVRAVSNPEHDPDGFLYGSFSFYSYGPGWRYIPNVTAGKSSRVCHPDVLTCARSRKMRRPIIDALIEFLKTEEADAVRTL